MTNEHPSNYFQIYHLIWLLPRQAIHLWFTEFGVSVAVSACVCDVRVFWICAMILRKNCLKIGYWLSNILHAAGFLCCRPTDKRSKIDFAHPSSHYALVAVVRKSVLFITTKNYVTECQAVQVQMKRILWLFASVYDKRDKEHVGKGHMQKYITIKPIVYSNFGWNWWLIFRENRLDLSLQTKAEIRSKWNFNRQTKIESSCEFEFDFGFEFSDSEIAPANLIRLFCQRSSQPRGTHNINSNTEFQFTPPSLSVSFYCQRSTLCDTYCNDISFFKRICYYLSIAWKIKYTIWTELHACVRLPSYKKWIPISSLAIFNATVIHIIFTYLCTIPWIILKAVREAIKCDSHEFSKSEEKRDMTVVWQ